MKLVNKFAMGSVVGVYAVHLTVCSYMTCGFAHTLPCNLCQYIVFTVVAVGVFVMPLLFIFGGFKDQNSRKYAVLVFFGVIYAAFAANAWVSGVF